MITYAQSLKDMLSDEIQTNSIMDTIMRDVLYGERNIFSRQVNPDKPNGISLSKRIEEKGLPFMASYHQARKELLSEIHIEQLEDLTQYMENNELQPGRKISDYHVRLRYENPLDQLRDFISAFDFINEHAAKPIKAIIEE